MAKKAKHAFGKLSGVQNAIKNDLIDAYDILFLDGDTEPKVGWIDKNGDFKLVDTQKVIVVDGESLPKSGELGKIYIFGNDGYFWNGTEFVNFCKPTDLTELKAEVETKADAEEVDSKIEEIKAVLDDVANKSYAHEKVKYEISGVPVGTIVDYREDEIRIMCPIDVVWAKQSVGAGGNPNSYYMTFKTYFPSENAVGYIEHLNEQVDDEILTKSSIDKYGRKYQSTWLALADYDESTDSWKYRGFKSTKDGYYGYNYQIDWYDANGKIITSDTVRINLSNENCHFVNEPYYVGSIMNEVDTKIEEKIEEIQVGYEIIEF